MIDLSKLTYENIVTCLLEMGAEFVNSYFQMGGLTYVINEIEQNYHPDMQMTPIIHFKVEFREIYYVFEPATNSINKLPCRLCSLKQS